MLRIGNLSAIYVVTRKFKYVSIKKGNMREGLI